MNKKIKSPKKNQDYTESEGSIQFISKSSLFPIVGIGASAGGLEALEQFFTNLPVNSGIAFVVIQHLDPNHKGMMRELLQRYTEMPVFTATDRLKVKPDCVYIIPPNKSMSILNGSLHLFDPVESRGLRLPVDFFLRSLADDRQNHSVGIILSGMGSDGSLGIKSIKEAGGVVLVQQPSSAKFDSMPRCAVESVVPDFVAPANELPTRLLTIVKQPKLVLIDPKIQKDTSSLEKIIILLRRQTGHDFSLYKKNTLYRRIERRMGIHQIEKIASYVRYLQENQAELEILFKELLIGVTSFFRDTLVWDYLRDSVIPVLFTRKSHENILRAWIPGCSTGEEAYSLAMVFKESIENFSAGQNFSLQIFATDLDSTAIDKARKGVYPANIIADVSQGRISRFFIKAGDQYRVNAEIREMVVFAPQNVIKDPPFTRLDFLCCRNLMIYLDSELQKKMLALFHYTLNSDGFLVLGSAETTGNQSELFSTIDSRLRIYKRSHSLRKDDLLDFPGAYSDSQPVITEIQNNVKVPDNLQSLTDQLLLQQFSPASVLVTDKGDILYITGSTGKYLEPAAGKANMNLFAMARSGLSNELPAAFRKAMQTYEKVLLRNLKITAESKVQLADVTIQQIEKPLALKGKLLVVFTDVRRINVKPVKRKSGETIESLIQGELKEELQRVKEELQGTNEEMQTSQEELKSANEELQSTNEELQSTNEELTTSKEEMQSLNEELQTVNLELQSKIDDFARVNNDMNNLLNSIEIATLFLDKELKIRQYTVPATKIFKLIPSDIGRLFTDQVSELDYPGINTDASEVLRSLMYIEKIVSTCDGRWFNVRIMPYRTFDDKIDGLVITFIDISQSRRMEDSLKEAQLMQLAFIRAVPGVIIGLSVNGKILEFNPEAEKVFNLKRDEVIGQNYYKLFVAEEARKPVEINMKILFSGALQGNYINDIKTVDGRELEIEWSAQRLLDESGKLIGVIGIGVNILSL